MTERAIAPVFGTAFLVLIVVSMTVVVGATAISISPHEASPTVVFSVDVSASEGTVEITHEHGDSIDVKSIELFVEIDGTALRHQPPVPFFSATGFRPGPRGPFNIATESTWSSGQSASFQLASTNSPTIQPSKRVTVTIYYDDTIIATVETYA